MGTHAHGIAVDKRDSETITEVKRNLQSAPQTGDVLASARTARADVYTISIVPAAAHLTATRHAAALEKVRDLARRLAVDGWFTCNHTHYARSSASANAAGTGMPRVASQRRRGIARPRIRPAAGCGSAKARMPSPGAA